MAKGRKTVDVEFVKNRVNKALASTDCDRERRKGMMVVLEDILHETKNYHGFRYLLQEEIPAGQKPGVRYNGHEILPYPERFEDTDDTRVHYY